MMWGLVGHNVVAMLITRIPPVRVLQLLQLVVSRKICVIPPYETARVDHVSEKNNKGVKLECLRLSIRGPASDSVKKSEVCIEEDSHFLVRQTSVFGGDVAEFRDYASFAGKQYPCTQLPSERGHVVIEAHVESLDSLGTDRTAFTGLSRAQPPTTCDDRKMPQLTARPHQRTPS